MSQMNDNTNQQQTQIKSKMNETVHVENDNMNEKGMALTNNVLESVLENIDGLLMDTIPPNPTLTPLPPIPTHSHSNMNNMNNMH
eukprot:CAMPEP_0201586192 /NCGR_PEP_ID=MMETSP0190_2-20130828/130050_1 /ASSEMBLY_ACC=CAM_ASM_000263 /TAXON_ID=37353 /ORGANISM="Rosalina sp." /LENGTH=84 /DNA_ID=CAMNT_0048033679 /DNA_START=6 /DNA_END=257 /DNA_ORIENTATION=+